MRKRLVISAWLVCSLLIAAKAQQVQWASQVLAYSSQYGNKDYAANQALGIPNALGNTRLHHMAWVPRKEESLTGEYIHVAFSKPMRIQQVAVAESLNPGAIHRIFLIDDQGKRHKIYENDKPHGLMAPFRLFRHSFPKTSYRVAELKLELKTKAVEGSNQIDAIGIADSRTPIQAGLKQQQTDDAAVRSEDLGPRINSSFAERLPLISPDGQTLFFARKYHPQNMGDDNRDDIWVAYRNAEGKWNRPINIGAPLNTRDHNFVVGVSPSGNTLYLANNYRSPGKAGVSVSHKGGRSWSMPKPLLIENHYNDNEFVSYFMGIDEDVLLMAVERKEGLGDLDLYVSFKIKERQWSEPRSLGPVINTIGIESSIFLAADQRTIYFSSNGHQGYGGLDMYMSRRLDDSWTNWSEPLNLGPHINNANNNYNYSIPASGEYAYFSRDDTKGMSDLFRIRLPEEVQPDPVMLVSGRVIDAETHQPVKARLQLRQLAKNKTERALEVPEGKFKMVLPYGKNLGVYAEIDGYFSVSESMELEGASLEELDGDQQSLVASTDTDDTFVVHNTAIEQLQLRINKLDAELDKVQLEREKARRLAAQDLKKDNHTFDPSHRSDPELDALKHRYQRLQQNKAEVKKHKKTPPDKSKASHSDKELARMRAKYDKAYNENEEKPSDAKLLGKKERKKDDKELRNMHDKLQRYYDRDSKVQPVQKPTAANKAQPPQPAVKDDFELIQRIVRQQLKNELSPLIRQELQNELLPKIALNVERELDDETRAKINNRMRTDIKKQLKADMQKINQAEEKQQLASKQKALEGLPAGFEKSLRQALRAEVKNQLREELYAGIQQSLYHELNYRIKKALELQYRQELSAKLKELERIERPAPLLAVAQQEELSMPGSPVIYQEVEQDILVVPIKVGQIIPMNNIFFDANESTLKPASTNELKRVLAFLTKESNLIIEIGGHTNGWCSSSFAHELSMQRAKTVAGYLVENGISEHRIQFRGYGKTKPIATNDSVVGRKKNQRVEMKILEIAE